MSYQKLGYFKTFPQRFRDYTKYSNNLRPAEYNDHWLNPGLKTPFSQNWAMLKHMHDLRVWTIAFAPSTKNNLQRLQEIHRINTEMWYYVSDAMWKRIIAGIFLYFFITKVAKHKFMNNGAKDSHDASWRDVSAHM